MSEQAGTRTQEVEIPIPVMKGKEDHVQTAIRQYHDRLEYIRTNSILQPSILRKRIFLWMFRTTIVAFIYLALWKFQWVRWTLIATVPLCVLNIISIFTWKYLLSQKLKRNQEELNTMEGQVIENPPSMEESGSR